MKIGIDGLLLRGRDAGSLRYFELLLESLANSEEEPVTDQATETGIPDRDSYQYIVFANRRVLRSAILPRCSSFSYQETAYHHFLPSALRQQVYKKWHALGELDLLHTPIFVPPLSYPGKSVMTLFDLTFLLHPHTQKWTGRLWWNLLGAKGFKKAERIITISNSTRRDLCQYLGVPKEKVDVIYPFVSAQFHPAPRNVSTAKRRAIADKYNLPEKYILFVSTLERRKNITSLIQAFSRARQMGNLEHGLVLVGQPGWLYQDVYRTIEALDLQKQVILPGYVPEVDLPGIYQAADLFAFLSDYEGFGFPVLEAMACGIPVLTSNASSLPEVVGQAGIMVPPHDLEQAAAQMVQLLRDTDLRVEMTQRGMEQARKFSRAQFKQKILAVYQRVIDQSSAVAYSAPSLTVSEGHPNTTPALSYRIPPGIQERRDIVHPVLSTPQDGMVILDRTMLSLWKKADNQSITDIISWAQSEGLPPPNTLAALASLAEAGLLRRMSNDTNPTPLASLVTKTEPADGFKLSSHGSTKNSGYSVSVVLVNFNSLVWLEACLDSLTAQTLPPEEIIIVDNASTDRSVEWIKQRLSLHAQPEIRLIQIDLLKPLSQALNLGIQAANGDYYLLLNPDLTLAPDAIEQMVSTARTDPNCAAVAAKLRFLWAPAFLNGLGNYVGGFTWGTDSGLGHLDLGQFDHWELLPSACFAAALIPARAFLQIGPVDECFPMYYEDSEWSYRARLLGYSILAAPQALVFHALGSRIPTTSDTSLSPRKLRHVVFGRLRFITKLVGPGLVVSLWISYLADDFIQCLLALLRGKWQNVLAYLGGWTDYLKSFPALQQERQQLQKRRKITDRALFSLQKKVPMPLVWHGVPQLTWDLIQNFYLPLLVTHQTRPVPEFLPDRATGSSSTASITQLPSLPGIEISPVRRISLLQRARQIQRAEGMTAVYHRFGRYIQWYLSRL